MVIPYLENSGRWSFVARDIVFKNAILQCAADARQVVRPIGWALKAASFAVIQIISDSLTGGQPGLF